MKKLMIVIGILILIMGVFLAWVFLGNPFLHLSLRLEADKYLSTKYPELQANSIRTRYSFKTGKYKAMVNIALDNEINFLSSRIRTLL